MALPDGAAALELYTAPDTGRPYVEVSWGRTRVLALLDHDGPTRVDAAWAAEHPDLVTAGTLSACRIGGCSFAAVPVEVTDLTPANAGLAWPTPVVVGRELTSQHDVHLDPEHAAWCVVARPRP